MRACRAARADGLLAEQASGHVVVKLQATPAGVDGPAACVHGFYREPPAQPHGIQRSDGPNGEAGEGMETGRTAGGGSVGEEENARCRKRDGGGTPSGGWVGERVVRGVIGYRSNINESIQMVPAYRCAKTGGIKKRRGTWWVERAEHKTSTRESNVKNSTS
jgi:hypothetical protein